MPNPTLRDLSIRNIHKTSYEYFSSEPSAARGFDITVPSQQTVVFDLDGTQIRCFGGGTVLFRRTYSSTNPVFRPEVIATCKSFALSPGETVETFSRLLLTQPTVQLYIEDRLVSTMTVKLSKYVPVMSPYVAVWRLEPATGFRIGFFGLSFRWLEYGDHYPWTT